MYPRGFSRQARFFRYVRRDHSYLKEGLLERGAVDMVHPHDEGFRGSTVRDFEGTFTRDHISHAIAPIVE